LKLVIEHDGSRTALPIAPSGLRIGRALDNDVHLADSRVSRHHCRVEPAAGGARVVDLGSANGLLINGERTRDGFMGPGDELRLGSALLSLELDAAEPEEEALRTELGDVDGAALALRALAESARAAARTPAIGLDELVDRAVAALRAERGFLVLRADRDPSRVRELGADRSTAAEGEEVHLVAARAFDRSDLRGAVPERLSSAVLERVLERGQPLHSLDAARDERLSATASTDELGLRSLLAVPVRMGADVVGVLQVDHRLQSGAFEPSDVELLGAFAALVELLLVRAADERRTTDARGRVRELAARLDAMGHDLGDDDTLAVAEPMRTREYPTIVGRSLAMREVFDRLDRIVDCELPVYVHGESGTGKELVARAIHEHGSRKGTAFVSENCAALPDSLLESELFGHAKGAFTGADRSKKGLLEQADGGTLFLDEIGDMSPEMQKKLLRVLQEGELRPVGSSQRVKVDVRLVSASHRDLERLVSEGAFREDLYYRINVLELRLPPLRERPEDVPLLARALLERAARQMHRPTPALAPAALERLCRHGWPGNVRELENEMRRAVVLGSEVVRADDLSTGIGVSVADEAPAPSAKGFRGDLPAVLADFERRAIEAALARHDGNKSRAADDLGLSRFALQRKLDKYAEQDGAPEEQGS
jgi:transcriptional regulator with GAF, ATPase, and Fis domain